MGKHKHTLLSSSWSFPSSLFFHSHFIFSALVLFQCPAVCPVPALTFTFLSIPLLCEEHTCTSFWRLSGHLPHIISHPERPSLPHLPRIQPAHFTYYLQTEVMYLTLSSSGHLKFMVTPRWTSTLQHHEQPSFAKETEAKTSLKKLG